jgi:hypothetical protein
MIQSLGPLRLCSIFFGPVPYFLHTYGTVILGHRGDGSNLMEVSTCTPLYAVSYPSY